MIQVVEVPLDNPAASREADVQPEISYPGDPDGRQEWREKGLRSMPAALARGGAVVCDDIMVHVEHNMAGAACAEQGFVWEVDEDGMPMTDASMLVGDDEVSGGPTQIEGPVDLPLGDVQQRRHRGELGRRVVGSGCPTMTTYQSRPWNPAGGTHKMGRMFFTDLEGTFLSEFHVGDIRPD